MYLNSKEIKFVFQFPVIESALYSGVLKSDHSRSRLFQDQISNGPGFKGSAIALAMAMVSPM